jgi:hypothetical protein
MNWKNSYLPVCLNLIGAIILLAGLVSAALIYRGAGDVPYGAWGYVNADGTIIPVKPEDSKMYRHNLEVYGGKANIIMDDFRRWFAGLWHGKSLAILVGCTALLISYGCFYTANYSIPRWKPAASNNGQDSAGD